MRSTIELLDKATDREPMPYWSARLQLARQTLHNSKARGHLSPAIAFALAEEIGEDPTEWALIAAAESERDSACKTRVLKRLSSACKTRVLKRLSSARKLYLSTLAARGVVRQRIYHAHDRASRNAGRGAKLPRH